MVNPAFTVQAAQFKSAQDHQHKVQLFFSIMLTLLEHQLLDLKERCTPAALATDPKLDVEGKFDRIAAAIKVSFSEALLPFGWSLFRLECVPILAGACYPLAGHSSWLLIPSDCGDQIWLYCSSHQGKLLQHCKVLSFSLGFLSLAGNPFLAAEPSCSLRPVLAAVLPPSRCTLCVLVLYSH